MHSPIKDEGGPTQRVTPEQTSTVNAAEEQPPDRLKPKRKKPKIVYFVGLTKYRVVKKVCSSFPGWTACEGEDDDWRRGGRLLSRFLRPNRGVIAAEPADLTQDILWSDASISVERLLKMKPYQKINHFVGTHAITRKNYLGRNLQRMKAYYPKEYKYFPSTWILPTDAASLRGECADKKKKTFIVKPDCGSQGRGIYLTQNIKEINFEESLVAQRYIHKPFLLDGLKFDLRLYVLITGCNPLRLFLHKDGLVRFATHKYELPNPRNCGDLRMHLTNYAINRSSTQFQQSTDPQDALGGHKRSLFHVMERLRQEGIDVDVIRAKISDMLIKTIIAIQPSLAHIYSSCQAADPTNSMCFEVFGADVVLDSRLEPWLLEVNHSPSFATDSPLDKQVKSAVIRDTLRLVGLSRKDRKRYLTSLKNVVQRNIAAVRTPFESRSRLEERDKEKAEFVQQRTEWEDKHLGGFERIYPTADSGTKYGHLFEAAREIWSNMTGVVRTRPLLDALQKSRRSPSARRAKAELERASTQTQIPSVARGSQAASGNVRRPKAAACRSSSFITPSRKRVGSTAVRSDSPSSTRDKSASSLELSKSRLQGRKSDEDERPLARVAKQQDQQQLPACLSVSPSSSLLAEGLLPPPTASNKLTLESKQELAASQASTAASSESRETAGHTSTESARSLAVHREEAFAWRAALLSSVSSALASAAAAPANAAGGRSKHASKQPYSQSQQTQTRLLPAAGRSSESRKAKRPTFRLPQVELSLTARSMLISKRPTKKTLSARKTDRGREDGAEERLSSASRGGRLMGVNELERKENADRRIRGSR
ncbi:hypothetical protein Efla_002108 [Eimeria flavescens]